MATQTADTRSTTHNESLTLIERIAWREASCHIAGRTNDAADPGDRRLSND